MDQEKQDQITETCIEHLGYLSKLLGSKSGYSKLHPKHVVIFNSNLYVEENGEYVKCWYGDIDITNEHKKLIDLYNDIQTPFYILYEMDGRFGNEDNPMINNHVVRVDNSGITLGDKWTKYFYITNNKPEVKDEFVRE